MSIIKNLLMKDLTLSQKIETAIAISDRIKVLQKLVDELLSKSSRVSLYG